MATGSTYIEAVSEALREEMQADERVYLMGEDIAVYGGAFKVTKGLSTRFPERVFDTPISEAGLTGLAGGMAMRGLRPVLEIMFGDFLTLCTDQLLNSLTKFTVMYGEPVEVPLVDAAYGYDPASGDKPGAGADGTGDGGGRDGANGVPPELDDGRSFAVKYEQAAWAAGWQERGRRARQPALPKAAEGEPPLRIDMLHHEPRKHFAPGLGSHGLDVGGEFRG